MKVCFIIQSFGSGGVTRRMMRFASGLKKRDYDVFFISCFDDDNPIEKKDFKYFSICQRKDEFALTKTKTIVKKIKSIIKKEKPNIVFSLYDLTSFWATLSIMFKPKIKSIIFVPLAPIKEENKNFRNKIALRFADRIIIQNEEQMPYFLKVKNKLDVLFNPIEKSWTNTVYNKRNEILKFVSIGRIHRFKNFSLPVKAMEIISKKYPNVTYSIYGYDEQINQTETIKLQNLISELHLKDTVKLCGRTDSSLKTLGDYDCFILSSTVEGMPNSLIEAMAVGLPCIATSCPTGPTTLIGKNNQRGYLSKSESLEEMVSNIEQIILHPDEAYNKSLAGKEFIKKECDIDTIVNKLIQIMNI